MKTAIRYAIFGILFLASACNTPDRPADTSKAPPPSPDVQFGALFNAVQTARIFPDSKTFADCTPKDEPAAILAAYEKEKAQEGFDLKAFALAHFDLPAAHSSQFKSDLTRSAAEHINDLWPVLTRPADSVLRGTLLPLPNPYVVPGGRFGEVYYWDSYFTMLGLEKAGRQDLIRHMVDNFAYLIDTYGHIPNGNRSYYLSRSQPPFFSLMVKLLSGGPEQYLPQLEKEYAFWMDGKDSLTMGRSAHLRVVLMPKGSVLNRYWDDRPAPRPESYREDVESARAAASRPAEEVYRHIKAAAESGWDFSSRWQVGKDLTAINTTDVLPVDLNCLLWHLEITLRDAWAAKGNLGKRDYYGRMASVRKEAIAALFFNPQSQWFEDYNWKEAKTTGVYSLAGMYPLYFGLADEISQAGVCARTLKQQFLRPGGLVATPYHTGQQWDAPNGWAPLQWISIEGLRRYGHRELADTIKKRWVDLNVNVYKRTGKMLEKYNVEDISLEAGGGEYPVQDGFGWTNGVLLRLLME